MEGLSKTERRLIQICLAAMLLSAAIFFGIWQSEKGGEKFAAFANGVSAVAASAVPAPESADPTVLHIWKIDDLYAVSGRSLQSRARPEILNVSHVLKWEAHAGKSFAVQISASPDFSDRRVRLRSANKFLNVNQAFAGDNYWRVSQVEPRWSRPARFFVRAVYLDETVEAGLPLRRTVSLRDGVADAGIKWSVPAEISGLIVEISRLPGFEREATTVSKVDGPIGGHKFTSPGTYYLRTRGFNRLQQVTEYSNVVEVKVVKSSL